MNEDLVLDGDAVLYGVCAGRYLKSIGIDTNDKKAMECKAILDEMGYNLVIANFTEILCVFKGEEMLEYTEMPEEYKKLKDRM